MPAIKDDLILTIDSDDDISDDEEPPLNDLKISGKHANQDLKAIEQDAKDINEEFEFEAVPQDLSANLDEWQYDLQALTSQKRGIDVNEIIRKRRKLNIRDSADASSEDVMLSENESDISADADSDVASDKSSEDDEDDEDDEHEHVEQIDGEEEEEEFHGFDDDVSLSASDGATHISGPTISEDEHKEELKSAVEETENHESAGVMHPLDHGFEDEDQPTTEYSDAELKRRKDYFAPEIDDTTDVVATNFQSMNLSRPILRALTLMNFSKATPIQSKAIPIALLGKDVVGGAVTGSGKTAAFMIPILERLLYRPKKVASTRVIVLCPTRELAMQCHAVARKLATYTDIKCCLVVGGLSLKMQEIELKTRPDIVIATPGRFIDHLRNSQGFNIDTIEIMVMDEADRMLEEGFADELDEIIKACPRNRQTMLFSATMTDKVDDLIRLSLDKPVRLLVDAKKATAENLIQEFIRIRPHKEKTRPAILLYLCRNLFHERVIIFFRSKVFAHRMRIAFGLLGLKADELHGNLSQEQRVAALESFRSGKIDFLLATDVASRGLDIKAIDVVINYEAPQSHEIYLHRIGRTARAGRQGRAVTLAGEDDRRVVKAAVKSSSDLKSKVQSRNVDAELIDKMHKELEALEVEIEAVIKEEAEEKQLRQAEMELKKGENSIKYQEEIMSRPRRTWFTTKEEKKAAERKGALQLNPDSTKSKCAAPPTSNKQKKRLDDTRERKEKRQPKKPSSMRQR